MWFRRDLRLADNPALLSAASDATDARVVPLFVLDPGLWRPAGPARRAYLAASLTDLGNRVGGLLLRRGEPVEEVVAVARAARATAVHIAERMRSLIENSPFPWQDKRISVTLSVGVAVATGLESDSLDLIRAADVALYKAKADGRNRVVAAS